ncbi:hypothetical protein COCON_G00001010 [Conger conger]|uniref:Uncharacterized protein n=1 Tax=Conger conger TaxID=82655 RepID=A0A9Q1I6B3_CONCO|nr:hypothetical protein COCON_G00001010 [Conger conger]
MGCSSSIKVKSKGPPTDTSKGDRVEQKDQEEPEARTLLEVEIHELNTASSQEGREKLVEVADVRDADGDGEGES